MAAMMANKSLDAKADGWCSPISFSMTGLYGIALPQSLAIVAAAYAQDSNNQAETIHAQDVLSTGKADRVAEATS
jgi:hypothetical protein